MYTLTFLTSFIAFIFNIKHTCTTSSRYILDDDNELSKLLPFPIDVCFESHYQFKYIRYECSPDGSEVYKKTWDSSHPTSLNDCNTNTNERDITTFNTSASVPCQRYNFNCTGEDNYLLQNIIQGNCIDPPVVVLPTVTGCFCLDTTSIQSNCTDAYNANFNRYNDTTTCSTTPISIGGDINNCTLIYNDLVYYYSSIQSCTINNITINKTPAPTIITSNPTTSQPTQITPSPISWTSRFIIDNDWLFQQRYPFPIDQCLQTQPFSASLGTAYEYIYYECNTQGTQVTKYKWTHNSLDSTFNCNNKTTANTTIITINTHNNNICNQYYFNCNGPDNYIVASFDASSGTDCIGTGGFKYPLFNISIVTDTCFCDDEQTSISHSITCNQNESILYDYTGTSSCVTTGTGNVFAKDNECISYGPHDFGPAGPRDIYITLKDCVENKVPTASPTIAPSMPTDTPTIQTNQPSISPTTPIPTQSPAITTEMPSRSPLFFDETHPPTTNHPTEGPIRTPTQLTFPPTGKPSESPSDNPTEMLATDKPTDVGGGGKTGDDKDSDDYMMIIIIVVVIIIVCCCLIIILLLWNKKKKEKKDNGTTASATANPKHLQVKSNDLDNDKSDDKSDNDMENDNDNETGDGDNAKTETLNLVKSEDVRDKDSDDDSHSSFDNEDDDSFEQFGDVGNDNDNDTRAVVAESNTKKHRKKKPPKKGGKNKKNKKKQKEHKMEEKEDNELKNNEEINVSDNEYDKKEETEMVDIGGIICDDKVDMDVSEDDNKQEVEEVEMDVVESDEKENVNNYKMEKKEDVNDEQDEFRKEEKEEIVKTEVVVVDIEEKEKVKGNIKDKDDDKEKEKKKKK
eukprot:471895_1